MKYLSPESNPPFINILKNVYIVTAIAESYSKLGKYNDAINQFRLILDSYIELRNKKYIMIDKLKDKLNTTDDELEKYNILGQIKEIEKDIRIIYIKESGIYLDIAKCYLSLESYEDSIQFLSKGLRTLHDNKVFGHKIEIMIKYYFAVIYEIVGNNNESIKYVSEFLNYDESDLEFKERMDCSLGSISFLHFAKYIERKKENINNMFKSHEFSEYLKEVNSNSNGSTHTLLNNDVNNELKLNESSSPIQMKINNNKILPKEQLLNSLIDAYAPNDDKNNKSNDHNIVIKDEFGNIINNNENNEIHPKSSSVSNNETEGGLLNPFKFEKEKDPFLMQAVNQVPSEDFKSKIYKQLKTVVDDQKKSTPPSESNMNMVTHLLNNLSNKIKDKGLIKILKEQYDLLMKLYKDVNSEEKLERSLKMILYTIDNHKKNLPSKKLVLIPLLLDAAYEYSSLNDFDKAEALINEALSIASLHTSDNSCYTANVLVHAGIIQLLRQNFEESEELLKRALDIKKSKLGDDHLFTAMVKFELSIVLWGRFKLIDSLHLYFEALSVISKYAKGNNQYSYYVRKTSETIQNIMLRMENFNEKFNKSL